MDRINIENRNMMMMLKVTGEGATEEVIGKFLLTYRTTPHQMLGGKSTVELLMGRTLRTTNYAMIPNVTNQ
ncbi:unnamed protein product [Hymenolepis diminuta]|uniref:Uncharacterized protein n=1 Tax=Hymenolepis diminuta TaxID=6216 RepID=A0A564XY59_HYMDI|nr:unnamed protein product [Hymenolepis diminuta]